MQRDQLTGEGGLSSESVAGAGGRRSLLQNALAAIDTLQARLVAAEGALHEPIAIVGLSCRVPGGGVDGGSFWKILEEGRDVVGEVPPDRWDVQGYHEPAPGSDDKPVTRAGGFLAKVDEFDAAFFGISPREARSMDPQQRLLLEAAWEALENAAIPPDSLSESLTGVFVGVTATDYSRRIDVADPSRSDMYLATGTALNAAAGRISFLLGLQGPCMAIDTACSSSLVAIHNACQSLRNRESDLALAGGVNLMLAPESFLMIAKWGMLAPDGRCKAFDAAADGFVRGEGCGLLVLERVSDAIANGRRVLALIRGSAINQDGRSSGLTVPNGIAQQAVIRRALEAAKLQPADIGYVEAHGTGTSLGDPIEVEALAAVYGEGRPTDRPLEIGSVKSNVGHLEAAAGVTGMIKVILAMQEGRLPASLHVRQPSPSIPWDDIPVQVSTRLHTWPIRHGRRLAGVSAFGFSGMNAHAILEGSDPVRPQASAGAGDRPSHLLVLSARGDDALNALARSYADHLRDHPDDAIADVCHTAAVGRANLTHRLAVVAADRGTLEARLRAGADGPGTVRGEVTEGGRHRIAFLFTGQGSQYCGMGRALYDTEPTFREVFDRCAAVLDPLLGQPLRGLVWEDEGALEQTGNAQPALYALEISLAMMWRSWGIEPSVVLGHSVGEYAAAAFAGVFSIEDGARLIAARGRLMQALPAGGAMIAVQGNEPADLRWIEAAVATVADQVSIAAWNGPASVVISGARLPAETIAQQCVSLGMRVQPLSVSHAFHSPLMTPMVGEFERVAASVNYLAPGLAWVSTLDGERFDWSRWQGRMPRYWSEHLRSAVRFESAMTALAREGHEICLEIGPHPVLTALGQEGSAGAGAMSWVASLHRKRPVWDQVLTALGRLFVSGAKIDWRAFDAGRGRRIVTLPTYPFQRRRHWIEAPAHRSAGAGAAHDLLGPAVAGPAGHVSFERSIGVDDPAWLSDHRVGGEVVMPMTGYVEVAIAASCACAIRAPWELRDLQIQEALILSTGQRRTLRVDVGPAEPDGRRQIRISSRDERNARHWTEHAILVAASAGGAASSAHLESVEAVRGTCDEAVDGAPISVSASELYESLRELGVEFGGSFRGMVRSRSLRPGIAVADIEDVTGTTIGPMTGAGAPVHRFHPALLDACLHAAPGAIRTLDDIDPTAVYLPVGIERFWLSKAVSGPLRSVASVRDRSADGEAISLDLRIEATDGSNVARIDGLRCRRTTRDVFADMQRRRASAWIHDVQWISRPHSAEPAAASGTWMVFDEGTGRAGRIADGLRARGGRVIRVVPGDGFARIGDDEFAIDPESLSDHQKVLSEACRSGLRAVVSLWPLRVAKIGTDCLPSDGQRYGTAAGLRLVQALAALSEPPRLCMVTAGSQWVDGTEAIAIEQAPVAALLRVAASEHPELGAISFDLDPQGSRQDERMLIAELLTESDENQVALRKGERFVARLVPQGHANQPDAEADSFRDSDRAMPLRLVVERPGTFDGLKMESGPIGEPGPGETVIRVRAAGVNFRDVLMSLGLYPGTVPPLGSDCAGTIVAVGPGVTGWSVGDSVVAMVEGAFSTHVIARQEFMARLPSSMDFEQGASTPSAFITADITLNQIAGLKRGDRVLIHAGAGGVGLAAVMLARRAGAEIFATAGSPDKREFLKGLGVQHVLDSRTAAFAEDVLRLTDGQGVDVVLNSLSGELLIRSFDVVARGGTFLEIGKRDIMSAARVEQMGRAIRYHVVDCSEIARRDPAIIGATLGRVLADIASGELDPLPLTTFRFRDAASALRFMAQARHIGRLVLRMPAPAAGTRICGEGTYLITGGLGGLGLVTARWLVGQGARYLALAGRKAPDSAAQAAILDLRASGAVVEPIQADVSTEDGVADLFAEMERTLPPIRGLFHCAGLLDDGPITVQTPERFAAVMKPKADGAWRLHRALASRGIAPDAFVLYSSMSSILGAPGQANYVCANAFLDALAFALRAAGQRAISINWGPWHEVGMAARGAVRGRWDGQGVNGLSTADGMTALSMIALRDEPRLAVMSVDWAAFAARTGLSTLPPILRDVIKEGAGLPPANAETGQDALIDGLHELGESERTVRIAALLRRELATVLALGDGGASIAEAQSFSSLGLDSLTAVELRNRLQRLLRTGFPSTIALAAPSLAQLSSLIASMLSGSRGGSAGESPADHVEREGLTL